MGGLLGMGVRTPWSLPLLILDKDGPLVPRQLLLAGGLPFKEGFGPFSLLILKFQVPAPARARDTSPLHSPSAVGSTNPPFPNHYFSRLTNCPERRPF